MGEERKLVLAAIAVRILFAALFFHIWDVVAFQEALHQFFSGGNVYAFVAKKTEELVQATGMNLHYEGYAYLPHALYILAPFYLAYRALGGVPEPIKGVEGTFYILKMYLLPDVYLFLLFIKLPLILADAATSYLLYRWFGRKYGWAYALNPYVVFITAFWGAFDGLVAFFLFTAVVMELKERSTLSGFLYGVSLMKFYTGLAVIPLLYHAGKKGRDRLGKFITGVVISQAPTIYYFIKDPASFLTATVFFHGSRVGNGVTPLNVLQEIHNFAFSVRVSAVASLIALFAWGLVSYYVVKKDLSLPEAVVLTIMSGLFLGKIVHEQYLLGIFPLLLLSDYDKVKTLGNLMLLFAVFNTGLIYFATPVMGLLPYPLWNWVLSVYRAAVWGAGILGATLANLRLALTFAVGSAFFIRIATYVMNKVG
ncbi:MAG: hypothetical protein J7L55_02605 [Desulfurococcales archaeon]|nr:hypothetical protein [Desulfurococcales archaeon]